MQAGTASANDVLGGSPLRVREWSRSRRRRPEDGSPASRLRRRRSRSAASRWRWTFDSRDNFIFTATRGTYLEASLRPLRQALGGDDTSNASRSRRHPVLPLAPRIFTLAFAMTSQRRLRRRAVLLQAVHLAARRAGDALPRRRVARSKPSSAGNSCRASACIGFAGGGIAWNDFERADDTANGRLRWRRVPLRNRSALRASTWASTSRSAETRRPSTFRRAAPGCGRRARASQPRCVTVSGDPIGLGLGCRHARQLAHGARMKPLLLGPVVASLPIMRPRPTRARLPLGQRASRTIQRCRDGGLN